MLRYLRRVDDLTNGALRWGILTNGARWRLYFSGARSVSEQFFEVDLAAVLAVPGHNDGLFKLTRDEQHHWFKVFVLVFRRQAFLPSPDHRTFHQRALDEGKFYEERVAQDLSDVVFGFAFPELARGIAAAAPLAPLNDARDAALVLLYRLLFILYAEDRDLLPVHERRYEDYGLRERVRLDVGKRMDAGDDPPKDASGSTRSEGGRETAIVAPADETLEQLSATSEVLKIIGASQGRLEPVFQALLQRAARLCEAKFGILYLYEDGGFRVGAMHNAPRAFAESIAQREQREPILRPGPLTPPARVIATKQVVHEPDYAASEPYKQRDPAAVRMVELAGGRTLLNVPMLKDKELIGDFSIYRQEVRPFTDRQIALVENFAAQGVIAIENTRLLNELGQRTADLSESLERQTATTEVLRVISSSPGELKPVFEAVLGNAVRICHAKFGNLTLYDGNQMRMAAMYNAPAAFEKLRREDPVIPLHRSVLGLLVASKQVTHIPDLTSSEPTASSSLVRMAGAKAALAVPMLRESELAGALIIYRDQPGWLAISAQNFALAIWPAHTFVMAFGPYICAAPLSGGRRPSSISPAITTRMRCSAIASSSVRKVCRILLPSGRSTEIWSRPFGSQHMYGGARLLISDDRRAVI
jgi:GAF domain-containing protein